MKRSLFSLALALLLLVTCGYAQEILRLESIEPWQGGRDSVLVPAAQHKQKTQASGAVSRFVLPQDPLSGTLSKVAPTMSSLYAAGKDMPARHMSSDASVMRPKLVTPECSIIDDGTRIKGVGILVVMGTQSFRPVEDFVFHTEIPYGNENPLFDFTNTVYADGKYYTAGGTAAFGLLLKNDFYVIDAETGKIDQYIEVGRDSWFGYPTHMAYNPATDEIWGIVYDGYKRPYLSRLTEEMDPDGPTGMFDMICQFYGSIATMAFDAQGTLYAITTTGDWVTIDLQTGELTKVGSTGKVNVQSAQGMAFDYYTGKCYWAAFTYVDEIGSALACDFYEVDPATGNLTHLRDLEDYTQIVGMHVESPKAPEKAPYVVDALSVEYDAPGSLQGTIHLTAPTKAYDKTDLSGSLDMEIQVDGTTVEETTLAAGADYEIDHTFTRGEHKISVIASNAAGEGVEGSITVYVGMDTPNPVTDLTLNVAEDGMATLTWTAPDGGMNGGYTNPAQVEYSLMRLPDSVDCGTVTTTTTMLQLPDSLLRYSFVVTPSIDDLEGTAVESNSVVYGDGIVPPFITNSTDENFINLSTLINNDTNIYNWDGNYVNSSGIGKTDDWYITPPFQLEPGVYHLRIRYEALSGPTNMKFTLGRDQTVAGHTGEDAVLIKDHQNLTGDWNTGIEEHWLDEYLTIEESGKYYIGINVYRNESDGVFTSAGWFDFELEQGPGMLAPSQPTALSAEAYPEGELKADITFTTPTKAFSGADLGSLQKVEVYNGDRLVSTVNRAQIGEVYTVTDENAFQGFNEYQVMATNEHGTGGAAWIEVYVGEDAPVMVSSMSGGYLNNYQVALNWGAPVDSGMNGGYVKADEVYYRIDRAYGDYNGFVTIPGAEALQQNTAYIDETMMVATEQTIISYGVVPYNEYGEGYMVGISVVLGKPYERFFNESFPASMLSTSYWSRSTLYGNGSWFIDDGSGSGIFPQDNDGGTAVFYSIDNEASSAAMISPIISLESSVNPELSFYMNHIPGAPTGNSLAVQVSGESGQFSELLRIDLSDGDGWKEHTVSLDDFSGQERVFIAFIGTASERAYQIGLDNISVRDNVEHDLEAFSFTAPGALVAGEPSMMKGVVRNTGKQEMSDYVVNLYVGEELIDSQEGVALTNAETAGFEFRVVPEARHIGEDAEYRLEVVAADDNNAGNNSLTLERPVGDNGMPAPRNLAYTFENGTVNLTWTAPEASNVTKMLDDFESYPAFENAAILPWQLWDEDRQLVTYLSGITFDNAGSPMAYQVWNPSRTEGGTLPSSWNPYEGEQCLVSWAAGGVYEDFTVAPAIQNDDWLVSPRIAGGTTLSFYASEGSSEYGHEGFEVLVSYTTREKEAFERIAAETLTGTEWTEYSYELPQDARYFAIRCVSSDKFGFLLDNIAYTTGYENLSFIGYNIYRNNEKLNEAPVSELTLSESSSIGTAYKVTAVYEEGESGFSNQVVVGDVATENSGKADIIVLGGKKQIRVEGAAGQSVQVYNTGGLLIGTFDAKQDTEIIPVGKTGVYVVRIGDMVGKVFVL